jgi:hypothetical protein
MMITTVRTFSHGIGGMIIALILLPSWVNAQRSTPQLTLISPALVMEQPSRALPEQLYGSHLSFPRWADASHSDVPYIRVKAAIGHNRHPKRAPWFISTMCCCASFGDHLCT